MTLKLFNTLSRNIEEFVPIQKGKVGMYTCGPTVYNYVHIGNLRAFIAQDILKRYLKYKGYKVTHVMNVTDVDDKTIRDSQKEKRSLKEFCEFYENEFFKDIKTLNIELADITPRATEHIKDMVEIIKKLKKNGHTYEKDGSIYFKISSSKDYGELSHLDFSRLKSNADGRLNDADEYEKEDARDFALWKSYEKSDGDVYWDTDIGKGRPGWHIECSAMSTKYLGDTFDIHCGGVDLIFPHHTNEIAQTEGATGKKWVNYWVHNEHLLVNGQKMSKSLGNFFTLRDLLDKGYKPLAIRFELLSTHYRQQLNFSEDSLKKVPATLNRLQEFMERITDLTESNNQVPHNDKINTIIDTAQKKFVDSMDDDLNISPAIAAVFDMIRETNSIIDKDNLSPGDAKKIHAQMLAFDSVLGLLKKIEKQDIPELILQLAKRRLDARKNKDFANSDKLRDEINKRGYNISDTPDGYKLKKS